MKNHLPFLTLMFSFIMIMIMCCCYVTPQQHTLNNSFISSPPLKCLPRISSALLQLKQEFVFEKSPHGDSPSYPKMQFWREGEDCCEWDGVTCSTKTGQPIGLDLSQSWLQGPLRSNSSLFTLSQLERLNLARNYFNYSKIPSSFGLLSRLSGRIPQLGNNSMFFTLSNLEVLDVSNNQLIGSIPQCLGSFSQDLQVVGTPDLSHNNLSGEILPYLGSISSLRWLSLSNNKFEGSIPSSLGNLTQLSYLDLSKNRLSGRIPQLGNNSMFCTFSNLVVLDVSNNQLIGSIPQCLGSFSKDLQVLNMKENNFSGEMPHIFVDGSKLITLDLSHNQLEGMVPQSLAKCNELQILNLGHNRLIDTFPFWLQNLTNLKVLVLRSNKFHGPIWDPNKYMGFKKLQIVDLSFNHFSGTLSSHYFTNWSAINTLNTGANKSRSLYMDEDDRSYYQESLAVTNKGFEMEFVRILTIFSCIDISNNNFHGEIPKSVGDLRSLIVLSLSSNNFEGHIPLSVENMKQLESLDLSNNKLSGRIPQELATLTFLEYLNLSNNQLTGMIPQSTQMSTFPKSSFYGNVELCGLPLSECEDNNDKMPSTRLDHESEFWSGFGWKAVAIGYACGFLGGLLGGYLFISKK
ncbi:receptor-like protein 43 isoform X2 [Cannabis sativa]|uniref:receptor-like protein 43 isoform X2 n=1 Tax=Cannabis sativa TaxID=3483 RepID=UPI0029CA9674|nr:receptor-like protein 43 isoform X2 [Cannabis sativa]